MGLKTQIPWLLGVALKGPRIKERRNTCVAKVAFTQNLFVKSALENVPNTQSKQRPKKYHLGGSQLMWAAVLDRTTPMRKFTVQIRQLSVSL